MSLHRTLPRLGRTPAFAVVSLALVVLMLAAGAPSPLFVVYQAQWHFGSAALTAVFAAYPLALLASLLTVGGLSDHVGRRPVLAAALALDAVAMLFFLGADGVGGLLLARAVQGLATGAAMGVVSAALVDLQPLRRPRAGVVVNSVGPTAGLAAGALGAGLVLDHLPAPTTVVFVALTAALVVLATLVAAVPETVTPRSGALKSLRPSASVPPRARRAFATAVPALVATWAIGGLYLSLGPSLVATQLHVQGHLAGGLVVAALTGAGSIAVLLVGDRAPRPTMAFGAATLAAGVLATLVALDVRSVAGFFAATVVAGVGFGTAFFGAFRSVAALPEPHERAELFAAAYTVNYLAFGVPTLLAGVAARQVGLLPTAMVYGVVVAVLGLVALGLGLRRAPATSPARTCPVTTTVTS
ncbi:MAG: MFS transporter [Oryzihumus sp.]